MAWRRLAMGSGSEDDQEADRKLIARLVPTKAATNLIFLAETCQTEHLECATAA